MQFNSLQFLVFCLIVLPAYFAVPRRSRWVLLLVASLFFYFSFGPAFILIVSAIILFDFFNGLWIERSGGKTRRRMLLAGILVNAAVLVGFKYYNFINQNLGNILSLFHFGPPFPYISILVPVGLSYITFQSVSYKIEIYRGNLKAERNPGILALYLILFTKVIAGPIEKPQKLIPQFRSRHEFDFELFKQGVMQIAWGLFKKCVIADRLAVVVDAAYKSQYAGHGPELAVATFFYAFQVYCDFSGYTDIALGVSRVMGLQLTDNFNKPYFSTSVADFWRRWHISLSQWLRDYIYLPVAYGLSRKWKREKYLGVKTEKWIYFAATGTAFLVCGAWHGAAWHFIVWGALFGFYLSFSVATSRYRKKFYRRTGIVRFPELLSFTRIITTFILVSFTWIFFRADSIRDAFLVIRNIGSFPWAVPRFPLNSAEMALCFLLILVLIVKERFFFSVRIRHPFTWGISLAALLLITYFFGIFENTQFIYFQF